MQKILIGTNSSLYASDTLVNSLIKDFGYDYNYWFDYIYNRENEFRTSEEIIKWMEQYNFGFGEDESDWDYMKFKIVEIPDNIKWHVRQHECDVSEYVAENYRTWE
jgi:hypothetical protein